MFKYSKKVSFYFESKYKTACNFAVIVTKTKTSLQFLSRSFQKTTGSSSSGTTATS